MNLFKKDKELVLKLTNAILVIWLIAAICFSVSNLTDVIVKEKQLTYDEYSIMFCSEEEGIESNDTCKNSYQHFVYSNDVADTNNVKYLIISIANVIIVSTSLYLLNRSSKKE